MRIENRAWLIALSVFGAVGLVAGCGGDDDDGADVSTGVARNKQLADMTSSEASQACDRLRAGFEQVVSRDVLVRTICTLLGAASTDVVSECNAERDDCIQKAADRSSATAMAVDMNAVEFECGDGAVLSGCTATVGQLETCFNETLDSLDAALQAITCEDAPTIDLDDLDGVTAAMFEPAASCDAVECPDSPFGPGDEE